MRNTLLLMFAALCLAGAAQAQKKVYRCADAKGQTVFQQSPCGGNTAGSQEAPKADGATSAAVPAARASGAAATAGKGSKGG